MRNKPKGQGTVGGTAADRQRASDGGEQGRNCVVLSGRLSGAAQGRVLPSGDTVVQLRLVVPRPPSRRRSRGDGRRAAPVDTIDVGVWTKTLQRRALKLDDGAEVSVEGALRRRFWRGAAGPVSRYEVEASRITVSRRG